MKTNFPRLLNNAGFSLVEVMVAAGILGVVTIGTMQLMQNISDGQRRMWQLMYISDVVDIVKNAATNQNSCIATLGGVNSPIPTDTNAPRDIANIRDATDTITLLGTGEYGTGTGRIRINSFQLVSNGANTFDVPKTAWIRINYEKSQANGTFGAASTQNVQIVVVPNAAGTLQRCFLADMVGAACGALGGTLTNGRCTQLDISANPNGRLTLPSAANGGGICEAGQAQCRTVFNAAQRCPWGAMNARCVNVVGISAGGTLMCGAAPAGTPCNP